MLVYMSARMSAVRACQAPTQAPPRSHALCSPLPLGRRPGGRGGGVSAVSAVSARVVSRAHDHRPCGSGVVGGNGGSAGMMMVGVTRRNLVCRAILDTSKSEDESFDLDDLDEETIAAMENAVSCFVASCSFEHSDDHSCTKFTVSCRDNQALLQAVAWTVNGMGYAMVDASLETTVDESDDEYLDANVTFTLHTKTKTALSDRDAADIAGRVEDVVHFCAPVNVAPTDGELDVDGAPVASHGHGDVTVHNEKGGKTTLIDVEGTHPATREPGALLEAASVLHAAGLRVVGAKIETVSGCNEPTHCGRRFRFQVLSSRGERLQHDRMFGIIYALEMALSQLVLSSDGKPSWMSDRLVAPALDS